MRTGRMFVAVAALAAAAPLGAPTTGVALTEARAGELARQVLRAGTWGEQRAAFERLTESEQVAVWRILTDVRPLPTVSVTRRWVPPAVPPPAEPAVSR